jgi:hypothetical protein
MGPRVGRVHRHVHRDRDHNLLNLGFARLVMLDHHDLGWGGLLLERSRRRFREPALATASHQRHHDTLADTGLFQRLEGRRVTGIHAAVHVDQGQQHLV